MNIFDYESFKTYYNELVNLPVYIYDNYIHPHINTHDPVYLKTMQIDALMHKYIQGFNDWFITLFDYIPKTFYMFRLQTQYEDGIFYRFRGGITKNKWKLFLLDHLNNPTKMETYKKPNLDVSSFVRIQDNLFTKNSKFYKNIWGFLNSIYNLDTISNIKLTCLEKFTLKYNTANAIGFINNNSRKIDKTNNISNIPNVFGINYDNFFVSQRTKIILNLFALKKFYK